MLNIVSMSKIAVQITYIYSCNWENKLYNRPSSVRVVFSI